MTLKLSQMIISPSRLFLRCKKWGPSYWFLATEARGSTWRFEYKVVNFKDWVQCFNKYSGLHTAFSMNNVINTGNLYQPKVWLRSADTYKNELTHLRPQISCESKLPQSKMVFDNEDEHLKPYYCVVHITLALRTNCCQC